jgi:glycosyltransferase involved in cell wall biosynthesis
MTAASPRIAVLAPCYNEEAAVAAVVKGFRQALPAAKIYVYDNNSRDRTAEVAREAGAEVRNERRQGKGQWSGFSAIGAFLALVSIGLAIPILVVYLETGLVPRLPTALLSTGLMIVAVLSVSSGPVLDTVTRGRREMKLLANLSQPPFGLTK